MDAVFVGLAGVLGAMCRYALFLISTMTSPSVGFLIPIGTLIGNKFPSMFPYGTLIVNLAGSFLLGLLIGHVNDLAFILLVGTGFMGAFTIFSTFKLESVMFIKKEAWSIWIWYTVLSYVFGILLTYLGYII